MDIYCTPLPTLHRMLATEDIGALPVGENDRLVGIPSISDLPHGGDAEQIAVSYRPFRHRAARTPKCLNGLKKATGSKTERLPP